MELAENLFNLPADYSVVESVIGQYARSREKVEFIAKTLEENKDVIAYFVDGNCGHQRADIARSIYGLDGAIKALNAGYWSRVMDLTGVYDWMPQKRRDEWNKAIQEMNTPEFERETVIATMRDLMLSRDKFFAERVDGVFRALSSEHVTNSPMGFRKRMIIGYCHTEWHPGSYSVNYSRAGYINDLRSVIAKFMGRDEPTNGVSHRVLEMLRRHFGEWKTMDGGAIRIRLYKKGTAHIEIHPDMAWRLNGVLHSLYPHAIPSEFRTAPPKKQKEYELIKRPLPFEILDFLGSARVDRRSIGFDYFSKGSQKYKEAIEILESIGGVQQSDGTVAFDYDPRSVIDEIVLSGCIPDYKSYQYYPTPKEVAELAVQMAEIGPDHWCLEPSAGCGGLADFMPKERTQCVEISELHANVLKAKGYSVVTADFLEWADAKTMWFNRIIMNPPFSEGRAMAHVEKALSLLSRHGRLVAILPASYRNKEIKGFDAEWSDPIENAFDKTGISVTIAVIEHG